MKLSGKVSIVTGAAQGIGRAIAERFIEEGSKVIAVDLMDIPYQLENLEGYKLNITSVEECNKFFNYVTEKYGRIDVLVNNAGITKDSLTRKMTDDQWDAVLAVNLKGAFNVTRLVGPYMQSNKSGSIVNIASLTGLVGNIGQANYAASKAGIIGLTKTWAKEFAFKEGNVRVNAIAPGAVMTDILKTIPEDVLNSIKNKSTLGRIAEPAEIAAVVLFFASEESSFVTGQVLSVDGGR